MSSPKNPEKEEIENVKKSKNENETTKKKNEKIEFKKHRIITRKFIK